MNKKTKLFMLLTIIISFCTGYRVHKEYNTPVSYYDKVDNIVISKDGFVTITMECNNAN